MLTMGQIAVLTSDVVFEAALSEDAQALTVTFGDGAEAEAGASTPPLVPRVVAAVLPLEGTDPRAEIQFAAEVSVDLFAGGTATVLMSVNGQSTVADFSGKTSETLTQVLAFAADTPPECRLLILLLAGRDTGSPEGDAFLKLASLDVEVRTRGC